MDNIISFGPSLIILVLGVLLLFAAIIGGGLEIKEIKIPKIGKTPRVLTAILGMMLMMCGACEGMVSYYHELPVAPTETPTSIPTQTQQPLATATIIVTKVLPTPTATSMSPLESTSIVDSVTLTPLFRLYDTKLGDHIYTTSKDEKGSILQNAAWTDEGITGYLASTQMSGTEPLFRLFSKINGDRLYTASRNERDSLLQNKDWRDEGITAYIATTQLPNTEPLFRLFDKVTGYHVYTADKNERDIVLQNPDWINEGITGYLWTTNK